MLLLAPVASSKCTHISMLQFHGDVKAYRVGPTVGEPIRDMGVWPLPVILV
jgi:hypothetical protein